jgi:hypothetical protein
MALFDRYVSCRPYDISICSLVSSEDEFGNVYHLAFTSSPTIYERSYMGP